MGGFYLNFIVEQCLIRERIKEQIIKQLPENELSLIKVSSREQNKIKWLEDGKEFRYCGIMYDVVKVRNLNDSTYYYCFCDLKESRLLTNLDKLVKDQTDHSQSRTIQKKHQIKVLLQHTLSFECYYTVPVRYFDQPTRYLFHISDVPSPPPWVLTTLT